MPPRRSAVLTVFGGATAINDGITAEPRRSWRCHCRLCRTSTAVAPRLLCDGGSTAEARRNMLKVSAVPPRRSAVLTVFGGATAINDGTTAELRRSWRCHCGLCRTSTAVAPRIRCDGGILPTVDDSNDVREERTTKKGRRKGSKGKNDDNWRYCVQNSPGSILDISKYRDTCERSISILHGIAILRYIEVSNDQTILGRYSYDPEYRRSILRYFRTDTAAEQ